MRSRYTIAFFITLLLFANGCGLLWHPGVVFTALFGESTPHNPDTYHIGEHRWQGDSIWVHVYRTSQPSQNGSIPSLQVECANCNLVNSSYPLVIDPDGNTQIFIPGARQLLSVRLHVFGSGIDTTFLQTEQPMQEAMSGYHFSEPLRGRVLIERFAVLYSDSLQDSVVTIANQGDEINFYGETKAFYVVQHPDFENPLYLLKSNAFRIE